MQSCLQGHVGDKHVSYYQHARLAAAASVMLFRHKVPNAIANNLTSQSI